MAAAIRHSARLRATIFLSVVALLALLLASTKAQAAPREFFGVMPQDGLSAEDYPRMGKAKVGTLRFQIHWSSIDPGPGPDYNWAPVDDLVAHLAANGIRPLPFIFGTPNWVAELDGHNCTGCGVFAPRRKPALKAFETFMADLARRYGSNGTFWALNPQIPKKPIRTWQIWNEQNSPTFYAPKPNVKKYLKLLQAAKAGVSIDRKAEVVVGGMFGTPLHGRKPAITSWDFLKKLYRIKGAHKYFDGVGIHPYAGTLKNVVKQTELMIDEIKKARDRKATTWVTELGWASEGPDTALVKTPKKQASNLKASFRYFLKNRKKFNTKTVIWYSWRDDIDGEGLCEWCPGSGLLQENGKPKPSFKQFTKFTGGS